jgi:coenzyme F420-reducing hydrogenase delta subunit
MREVLICGLFKPDYSPDGVALLASTPGEIWTVNDWYMHTILPREPSQIWNIHRFPHVHPDPRRFVNWKSHYNNASAKGSRIIGLEPMEGVNNVELLDICALELAAPMCMGCSPSIMVAKAALDGFDAIHVFGVALTEKEYQHDIYTIFESIKFARRRGCRVTIHPDGREQSWMTRMLAFVDWAGIVEAYRPYWKRQAKPIPKAKPMDGWKPPGVVDMENSKNNYTGKGAQ